MSEAAKQLTDMILGHVASEVSLTAIGNSTRKMKDIAIDLVNASGLKHGVIADGTFLCESTISKLVETDENKATRNPQCETVERIFRYFNMRMTLNGDIISSKFVNHAKSLDMREEDLAHGGER